MRAVKVSLANWFEGVLEADEAVVATAEVVEDVLDVAVDPVVFAEVPSASAANCPVMLERSVCSVANICCSRFRD
jgi:hypothetical protein